MSHDWVADELARHLSDGHHSSRHCIPSLGMIGTRSLGLGLQQARSQSRAATADSRLCSEYLGAAVQLKPSAVIRTLEVQSSTVLTSAWGAPAASQCETVTWPAAGQVDKNSAS